MERMIIIAAALMMFGTAAGEEPKIYSNDDLKQYRGYNDHRTNAEMLSKPSKPPTDKEMEEYWKERNAADSEYMARKNQEMIQDANRKYAEIEAKEKARKARIERADKFRDRMDKYQQQQKLDNIERELRDTNSKLNQIENDRRWNLRR